MFDAFGTRVTQLLRGTRMLRTHDDDIAATFTEHAAARWDVRTNTKIAKAAVGERSVRLELTGDEAGELDVDVVLVATGRVPNADRLAVAATGVAVDDDGYVVVDEYQRTTVDGMFALGDLSSPWELKHVANHEMRVVRHNLAHPDAMMPADHRFVPHAVFTEPQIAAVGITERQAVAAGVRHVVVRHDYGDTAAGWAREDTTGFVKLIADPDSGLLLGAHLIGPEAATVIQPLIQAMSFGQTAADVARLQYWIHPALPEVIENALLKVAELSAGAA